MKRHPLVIAVAKKEIESLEAAAQKATSKDQYMKLRVQAFKKRMFYGIA